jgi:hypothetical protein
MLLFQLSTAFALFALNPLAFGKRQHFLVLDAELSAVQLEVVH